MSKALDLYFEALEAWEAGNGSNEDVLACMERVRPPQHTVCTDGSCGCRQKHLTGIQGRRPILSTTHRRRRGCHT